MGNRLQSIIDTAYRRLRIKLKLHAKNSLRTQKINTIMQASMMGTSGAWTASFFGVGFRYVYPRIVASGLFPDGTVLMMHISY